MIGRLITRLFIIALVHLAGLTAALLGPAFRGMGLTEANRDLLLTNISTVLLGAPATTAPVFSVLGPYNAAEHEQIVRETAAILKKVVTEYEVQLTDAQLSNFVTQVRDKLL